MPQLQISMENLLATLSRLKDDNPAQIKTFLHILNEMPDPWVEHFITQRYYDNYCKYPYYKAQHATFKHMVFYSTTPSGLADQIEPYNLKETPIKPTQVTASTRSNGLLAGFSITRHNTE